jgi:glutaredoxin
MFSLKVVMYATRWCPYCAKARVNFNSNHIAFNEQDIENNSSAKHAYDELGGNGVPLILVGNERMQGFGAEQFDAIYQQQLQAKER